MILSQMAFALGACGGAGKNPDAARSEPALDRAQDSMRLHGRLAGSRKGWHTGVRYVSPPPAGRLCAAGGDAELSEQIRLVKVQVDHPCPAPSRAR